MRLTEEGCPHVKETFCKRLFTSLDYWRLMLCHHILAGDVFSGSKLAGPFVLTAMGNPACCSIDNVSVASEMQDCNLDG